MDIEISRATYLNRRATHLDKVTPPGWRQKTDAFHQAKQVFAPSNLPMTFQKIVEREACLRLLTSTAADFRGVGEPGQTKITKQEYEDAHARALQRSENSQWASSHADVVFRKVRRPLLAMEILKLELAHKFDLLLPLPTTENLQSVDDSLGTGAVRPLSDVSSDRYRRESASIVLHRTNLPAFLDLFDYPLPFLIRWMFQLISNMYSLMHFSSQKTRCSKS